MGKYQRKDHYYRKAKEQGLPSRASFKIEEILNKYKLVKPGATVLELGAAPGGWTVKLLEAVGPQGKVLAFDLETMDGVQGGQLRFFQGDAFGSEAEAWLKDNLAGRKADAIFSDISPKLSGIEFRDAYLSYEFCMHALELAQRILKRGGHLVTKIFPGSEFPDYLKSLRENFNKVQSFEPKSSRKTSREVYVVAMNFKK
jgi:23S rRNA (uridine2552-2'-O)-methyltransferase